MRAKSFALLVLALGCGLVASIGITQVMSKEEPEPVLTGETETVFVATEDIGMGDLLESNLLRLEQWPKGKVPEGALTKIEDVEGRRTKTTLYAGEPILERKMYPKGTSGAGPSGLLPKGYRLATVRVDSTSGAHGMILPGDRVDVQLYVEGSRTHGVAESGVYTILQDIKVFACNDTVEPDATEGGTKSIKAQTVSLMVTPGQAKKIILAAKVGEVSLVLRSPEDSEILPDQVVTIQDILKTTDGADREKEIPEEEATLADGKPSSGLQGFLDRLREGAVAATQPAVPVMPAATPDARERWSMRIGRGSQIEHIVLEAEPDPSGSGAKQWRISTSGAVAALGPAANVFGSMPSAMQQPDAQESPQPPDEEEDRGEGEQVTADGYR